MTDLNATQAAIKAGYSKKTAQEQSSRLLSNVIIQKHIEKLREKQTKRTEIDADYVIKGILEVVTAEGVKHNDKLKGLELLGRHLAMFIDRQRIAGEDGGPVPIRVIKEYLGEKPTAAEEAVAYALGIKVINP